MGGDPSSVCPSVRPSSVHNYIFDFFSKTVSQIHFKLDGNVPWMGLYQVCSNGHGPVIFLNLGIYKSMHTILLITM